MHARVWNQKPGSQTQFRAPDASWRSAMTVMVSARHTRLLHVVLGGKAPDGRQVGRRQGDRLDEAWAAA